MYARQALESLGLWAVMRPKVVAGADVRHALAYVEQGAAEAGIVYATDAFISDRVTIVMDIPHEAGPSVVYPLVLLSSAQGDAVAESFYSYLQCPAADAVFEKYGFTSINEPVGVAR
jgi:molybdate transport system substrate-binding protein